MPYDVYQKSLCIMITHSVREQRVKIDISHLHTIDKKIVTFNKWMTPNIGTEKIVHLTNE